MVAGGVEYAGCHLNRRVPILTGTPERGLSAIYLEQATLCDFRINTNGGIMVLRRALPGNKKPDGFGKTGGADLPCCHCVETRFDNRIVRAAHQYGEGDLPQ